MVRLDEERRKTDFHDHREIAETRFDNGKENGHYVARNIYVGTFMDYAEFPAIFCFIYTEFHALPISTGSQIGILDDYFAAPGFRVTSKINVFE